MSYEHKKEKDNREENEKEGGSRRVRLTVVGAGLAGSEAALTAASFGADVTLIDSKPGVRSPAHMSDCFAELVCSNSLKSDRIDTAQGLLKHELRSMGSHLIAIADKTSVPAGGALAVDRDKFSQSVTDAIIRHPNIRIVEKTVRHLDDVTDSDVVIIATGPLTSGSLYESIEQMTGVGGMHFYDAVAPIVDASTLDLKHTFVASRYGKGGNDYINCPMNEDEYTAFREALVEAERATIRDFDRIYFKDCQPVEVLAERGMDTLRFGPFRPVGLIDPRTGKRPYACLQLRRENEKGTMVSLVGCQTRLTFPEQRRVFGIIPALKNVQFLRYGVMHRNSFLNGPSVLSKGFRSRENRRLFFAGQLSGLEGYVEAIASGLMAAIAALGVAKSLSFEEIESMIPTPETMMGALAHWVSSSNEETFQPMNANYGLLPLSEEPVRIKKKDRPGIRAERSEKALKKTIFAIESLLGELPRKSAERDVARDLLTTSYDYDLPRELIANRPTEVRDRSRLLVMKNGMPLEHRLFADLPSYLSPGDCLVLNDTRVIPARLYGRRDSTGANLEFLLLRRIEGNKWRTLVKPARRAQRRDRVIFPEDGSECVILEVEPDGARIVEFFCEGDFYTWLERIGEMPTPPYIKEKLEVPERYQTIYAKERGSAAAPTAGLHFTEELLRKIESNGVNIARVTLHVGLGTFRPVKENVITDHKMHEEWYAFNEDAARLINETKKTGSRVIAVGTTSCRILESVAAMQHYRDGDAPLSPMTGETDLFIYPGFRFRVIDAMITNFHLPCSTLLMLVSALMGREAILEAYRVAVEEKYRFFSFGDAMLLLP
ncbi:MAG: methylenetetrahydrofolate--tRNA-(uracil(54)-C(5))-methyltransferase (FADH(2)-oxidizing) TrmFO [Saccharofermentanales bacterium]|jgi:methylenetetrahydrofolate--tRNA-(uracil-5-)-methyltransferase